MKPKFIPLMLLASCFTVGVANAQLFWNVDQVPNTWTSANWGTLPVGPFTNGWIAGSDAIFNVDSSIGYVTNTNVGNITVADGAIVNVTPAGTFNTGGNVRTVTVGTNAVFNMAGQNISTAGSTGFIKDGDGTWNMGANGNLYTGGFTLNEGRVIVGGNNNFGNGVLTINGGIIQSSGGRTFAPSSVVIGGDFEIAGTGGWTMNMPVELGAATRTITNNATGTKTWNGVVSGAAGSGLTFAGTGTNVFTNASNTFSGPITVLGSEVEFQNAGSLGSGTSIEIDGGRLALRGTFTVDPTKSITLGSAAELSTPGGSSVIAYNGVISDKTAMTGDLVKQGGGILDLGGVSTYSGFTSINNGTIRLNDGNDRLPTGTVLNLGQAASTNLGTLDLNGRDQTIAGLSSTTGNNANLSNTNVVTSATDATLTINTAISTGYLYSDGTAANSGIISGRVSLVKDGDGTQFLGGANTYSGSTTINGGVLALNGGGTLGAGDIILNGGTLSLGAITPGTFEITSGQSLSGTGTVSATNKIFEINGTLNPGFSAGTIDITADVVFLGVNSISNFEIFGLGAGEYDLLNVDGLLNILGGTLNLSTTGTYNVGDTVQLFDATGINGNFDTINGTDIGGGLFWDTSMVSSFGTITVAIPEPSTALLGALGVLALLRRRR